MVKDVFIENLKTLLINLLLTCIMKGETQFVIFRESMRQKRVYNHLQYHCFLHSYFGAVAICFFG